MEDFGRGLCSEVDFKELKMMMINNKITINLAKNLLNTNSKQAAAAYPLKRNKRIETNNKSNTTHGTNEMAAK